MAASCGIRGHPPVWSAAAKSDETARFALLLCSANRIARHSGEFGHGRAARQGGRGSLAASAARRHFGQDASCLRRARRYRRSRQIGDHDRSAASHAFQQHVGPAFAGRDEQKEIGRAVNFGQTVLRHAAEEDGRDRRLRRSRASRSIAGRSGPSPTMTNSTSGIWASRLDHQTMALQRDQIADREKRRPGQAEGLPCRVTVHVVGIGRDPPRCAARRPVRRATPRSDEPLLQSARNRDQAVGMPRRP